MMIKIGHIEISGLTEPAQFDLVKNEHGEQILISATEKQAVDDGATNTKYMIFATRKGLRAFIDSAEEWLSNN